MLESIKLQVCNGKESFILRYVQEITGINLILCSKGITSIGREFFGISDKRISRRQAEINVTDDSVTIIPVSRSNLPYNV